MIVCLYHDSLFCTIYPLILQKSWLNAFDASNIQLRCKVYYGDAPLKSMRSDVTPVEKNVVSQDDGSRRYLVTFPLQRFVFSDFDLKKYDIEEAIGSQPYADISVIYQRSLVSSGASPDVTLGTARFQLFRRVMAGEDNSGEWTLVTGDQVCDLRPRRLSTDDEDTEAPTSILIGQSIHNLCITKGIYYCSFSNCIFMAPFWCNHCDIHIETIRFLYFTILYFWVLNLFSFHKWRVAFFCTRLSILFLYELYFSIYCYYSLFYLVFSLLFSP